MSNQRYPSAVRAATFVGDDNPASIAGERLTVVLDVTAVPGVDTVTPIIEGKDALSGKYYTVLQGTAMAATGTQVLTVAQGIAATANVSANALIPRIYRMRVIHSAGTSFTYSLSATET